jgi:hypothetical protein
MRKKLAPRRLLNRKAQMKHGKNSSGGRTSCAQPERPDDAAGRAEPLTRVRGEPKPGYRTNVGRNWICLWAGGSRRSVPRRPLRLTQRWLRSSLASRGRRICRMSLGGEARGLHKVSADRRGRGPQKVTPGLSHRQRCALCARSSARGASIARCPWPRPLQ